jgi:hypothetical protein
VAGRGMCWMGFRALSSSGTTSRSVIQCRLSNHWCSGYVVIEALGRVDTTFLQTRSFGESTDATLPPPEILEPYEGVLPSHIVVLDVGSQPVTRQPCPRLTPLPSAWLGGATADGG